ncbi:MAG: glycosyltransferase family 2 protein [Cyanobacteria bacterium]|nr:glycosyltransferase family 2 protein [Cyanobacteriota bacterium]
MNSAHAVQSDLPMISIVTPSYNQGIYLEQCIKSIVDQGYPRLQYIVVDGGSSDETSAILDKYSAQIDAIISEPDRGHAHALNKGFALCKGSIMGWLNSDDILAPRSLWTLASIFRSLPDVSWITGTHCLINKLGFIEETGVHNKNIYDYIVNNYQWIQQESTFWRRSLWDKAGGFIDESMRFMVDGDLWCRFFLHEALYGVDAVLAGWRRTGDNRSSKNISLCFDEMESCIRDMRLQLDRDFLTHLLPLRVAARIADSKFSRRLKLRQFLWKFLMIFLGRLKNSSPFRYKRIRLEVGAERWVVYSVPFR